MLYDNIKHESKSIRRYEIEIVKNQENKIPQKFPKNRRKSGNYCRWEFSLKIPQRLGWGRGRHFWGKSGTNWGRGQTFYWGSLGNVPQKFPQSRGGDGENIVGESWGPMGDGDKLVAGEFWGISPKIPQKPGWGRGRHFRGYAPL